MTNEPDNQFEEPDLIIVRLVVRFQPPVFFLELVDPLWLLDLQAAVCAMSVVLRLHDHSNHLTEFGNFLFLSHTHLGHMQLMDDLVASSRYRSDLLFCVQNTATATQNLDLFHGVGQFSVPTKNRVGREDCRQLIQSLSPQGLTFDGQ